MKAVYPPKLRAGATVRVVAPSRSKAMVDEHDHSGVIDARFRRLGLLLTYGDHVDTRDPFDSSPVAERVADLHAAFADPDVDAILTVIGGFNSNELLPFLNWDLIAANPKIFCGYSDITSLQNAAGRLLGGNLCTFNLLQGSGYRPDLDGALLFVEDDELSHPATFARDLTSVLQLPDAPDIRGLLIGRFQGASGMTRQLLERIVANQPGLAGLPVLANVDFGHTDPMATLPVGGQAELVVADTSRLILTRH